MRYPSRGARSDKFIIFYDASAASGASQASGALRPDTLGIHWPIANRRHGAFGVRDNIFKSRQGSTCLFELGFDAVE